MKGDKLHIIIAEEEGKVRRVSVSVSFVRWAVGLGGVLLLFFVIMSLFSFKFMVSNRKYSRLVASLSAQLEAVKAENAQLKNRVFALEKEKDKVLKDAVAELKEKSSAIERLFSEIGLKSGNGTSGKGGPFVPAAFDGDYRKLLKRAEYLIKNLKYIPLGYPVYGKITSGFGMRIDPFNGRWAFHSGVDIKGRVGMPIRATAFGVVKRIGYSRGYGKYVVIYHGKGFSTLYAHLSRIKVRKGQKVKRGDVVGLMGNTGRSTGPHLHYEVRLGKKPINPLRFMRLKKTIVKVKSHV